MRNASSRPEVARSATSIARFRGSTQAVEANCVEQLRIDSTSVVGSLENAVVGYALCRCKGDLDLRWLALIGVPDYYDQFEELGTPRFNPEIKTTHR